MTQLNITSKPHLSAFSKLLSELIITSQAEALAQEVLFNLQYQHRWSDLRLHKIVPSSSGSPARLVDHDYSHDQVAETVTPASADTDANDDTTYLISGLPPRHMYIHPDLQKHLIKSNTPVTVIDIPREYVLPLSTGHKANLKFFAGIFDVLLSPAEIVVSGQARQRDDEGERHEYVHQDAKRVILGMLAHNGMGGDGTVTYYVMQEGDVKPRQNGPIRLLRQVPVSMYAHYPHTSKPNGHLNGNARQPRIPPRKSSMPPPVPPRLQYETRARADPSVINLLVCVGGIYASFLTWGLLQERITKTPYSRVPSSFLHGAGGKSGPAAVEFFRYPIFVNAIQALFAFTIGSIYMLVTSKSGWTPFPAKPAMLPILAVSITQTLASPFGYASLKYVDYVTFVLAKSCKLLPVMAIQVLWFRRRYAISKYAIVAAVTGGVAVFTMFSDSGRKSKNAESSSVYGLCLLGVNLLFDGVTNAVQDEIFKNPQKYGHVDGKQMMVSSNLFGFLMQGAYLVLLPLIPTSVLPGFVPASATTEVSGALAFLQRHPSVTKDILGFCAAGAIGQLFIFATLERFSSLLLVTVTVTRKMLTMLLSVVYYEKSLALEQWGGVGMVFGGIAFEAFLSQRDKAGKAKVKTR
ncbi:UDP-galactose transporter [Elasticomyces elasticus]|nr:UDP-galactose transporter [Elasticomyces elasticus]